MESIKIMIIKLITKINIDNYVNVKFIRAENLSTRLLLK